MTLVLPDALLGYADRGPEWGDWLDRLPGLVRGLLGEWELAPEGPPMHGHGSLVLPVRVAANAGEAPELVLKVAFPDVDTEQEHLALHHWHGRAAVRMLRADPRRNAMLLERLHATDLAERWDLEVCEIIGGLYRQIHVPAPPRLRSLGWYVERWVDPMRRLPRDAPIPHRLVEQTLSLAGDLLADAAEPVLLHGDLHDGNVLMSADGEWRVIDPQPKAGDPHWEPAPLLWNRWEELAAGPGGVREGVRRRFHAAIDAAGLDEERARDWTIVRMVIDAHWSIEDADRLGRALDPEERDWITRCVAIAKAVQE